MPGSLDRSPRMIPVKDYDDVDLRQVDKRGDGVYRVPWSVVTGTRFFDGTVGYLGPDHNGVLPGETHTVVVLGGERVGTIVEKA